MPQTTEHKRLKGYRERKSNWRNLGSYLIERAWGTVREDYSEQGTAWDYFPHDHARLSRYQLAYGHLCDSEFDDYQNDPRRDQPDWCALTAHTLLFLGWFGPRDIASILYCLLVLEAADLAGRDPMFAIIMITVLISVFAHGLTAVPAAEWYGAHAETMKSEPDTPELVSVTEMPLRLRTFPEG